ncbi:MAG: response regulator, partial [Candidatus Omnitrophota bacterium]|nr:response regulator [Candidatus Omnitrophota bacterium]
FNAGLLFSQFRPHIVTLDLRMPMVDGFEVCAQIRKDPANKDVKILVISDVDDPQEQKRILQMGADDLLVKPISSAELMKRVERLAALY